MKITDWAIVVVLIVAPLLWFGSIHSEQLREKSKLQIQYTSALRTAVQDGGVALNINELQYFESGYGSHKFMKVDKERGLEAMLNTLAINFGIVDDPIARQALMLYIPAVLVIDYDGYYVYAIQESVEDGIVVSEHQWAPKRPFLYRNESGLSVAFTLDDYVTTINTYDGEELQGRYEDVATVAPYPLFRDRDQFEMVRRSAIVRVIEEDLTQIIHRHNEYTFGLGYHYVFTLPFISQEDWNNTVDDVGMIVFLQGLPVGDQSYNNFALGGGRVVKVKDIAGGINPSNGIKYQSNELLDFPYSVNELFANELDAARKGYFEWKR